MIESIEGKRGLPRHRPPYRGAGRRLRAADAGAQCRDAALGGAHLREGPEVLSLGREERAQGAAQLFGVGPGEAIPGVHLLPAGSTINDVIEAAGGMADGARFKAYQPGGPSSGLLPASMDDMPLDFDTLQPHGTSSARRRWWCCRTGQRPRRRAEHAAVLRG
jgi:NADH:ubiquinone oxidoreductase subunit F (NADH-binding)